jgi:hypothetical protein
MTEAPYETLKQNANVGRVRLTPYVISFYPDGPAAHDDQWLPTEDAEDALQLQNCSTGHVWQLASSDVANVVPDLAATNDGLVNLRAVLR